ncbi:maleylpyruvate isomerase family mycothiol-dependent enzyme [Phytomonospora sp. NPDC050363]|uniref:maleylpyruvate isomerase family mycothiol-dependent enzyme n=1 Tax=Phytomonospora sp. NPDC050363 TaxID=3155642 RepID=UPI0033DAD5EB
MTNWDKTDYLDALHRDATAFRGALAPDTLDSPVPPCPDWTLRDLAVHLGTVHQRIAAVVKRGALDKPDDLPVDAPADVAGFFDASYAELSATLQAMPADGPAWNWAPQPKTALFWARRAALETALHRWDAQVSVGVTEPIGDDLADDGIDEVLDTWLPAGRRLDPATDAAGLAHLIATDSEKEWFLRLNGERVVLLDAPSVDSDEPVDVRASGPASDVLLSLWGRVPFDMLSIEGDPALLSALRTG